MIDKIRKVIKPVNRGEANVEAEKGETIVTYLFGISIPEHYKIEGKKHEKGGTPLKVPDGSFVFSDDKKMIVDDPNILKFFGESKPKTPAQIAKKYELNEYKAKLIDPDTDQISKITSALMLKNNYEKLAQLALYQEAKKGFKDGVPKFAEDYLASIGIEPDQLIEAVKGKMEEKIYEKPSVDDQGNPIMQEGGDPTKPLTQQQKEEVFNRILNKVINKIEANPNNVGKVFDPSLAFTSKEDRDAFLNEFVNYVDKSGRLNQYVTDKDSVLALLNTTIVRDLNNNSNQNKPNENVAGVSQPQNADNSTISPLSPKSLAEEPSVTLTQQQDADDSIIPPLSPKPLEEEPSADIVNNTKEVPLIPEPKGKDVAEKRKWLQSEEGKKWLESEDGKRWSQTQDGKGYKQELRYNKLISIANRLLPNQPIEITMGGMDGIANLTMMATEASKWNLGKPKSQQFSADNVFQPVKGIDRGDYSAAGSTYGQFRPNEQTPKYTEAIPYEEGGGVKDGEEPKKDNKDDNTYLQVPLDDPAYMAWLVKSKSDVKNEVENNIPYTFPALPGFEDKLPKVLNPEHVKMLDPENIRRNAESYFKDNPPKEVKTNEESQKQQPKSEEKTKTEEQNKIEEQYKPKIKRKYYTQDIRNIAAALGQLAGVKMYLPWSAPIDYMVPRAVYYDPTREIQGAATVANTQGKLMQAYLSPQSAMANMSEQQARLAEQTANIVANAQQRNVGVANQMEQQRAGIYNQAANMERARQQELYNQTITARQQYDNARRKALAGYIAALNQADENAARAYNLSNVVFADSPFYIDPATGQIEIDKSRVKLDKSKTPDKSLEERIKESYKEYKSAGIPDNIIDSLIRAQYFGGSGKSTKEKDDKDSESEKTINRQARGIYNASSKSTDSKFEDEEDDTEEKKLGGEVGTIINFLKSKYLS